MSFYEICFYHYHQLTIQGGVRIFICLGSCEVVNLAQNAWGASVVDSNVEQISVKIHLVVVQSIG